MRLTTWLTITTLTLSATPLFAPAAQAFPVNQCASDRLGVDLGCTAGDVSISSIAITAGGTPTCVGEQSLVFDLDVTINAANAKRYDIGVFLSNDGKSTRLTSAHNGAATCSVGIVPKTPLPFKDWDTDACGDIDGPGSGKFPMSNVTVLCSAAGSTTGKLAIPFTVTWDVNAAGTCSSVADPIPSTQSKCNAPLVLQTVEVVVLPVITNTDGRDFIKPGAATTYTVVIINNTGIALSTAGGNAVVFRDPAVANLTVSGVTCSAVDGASCPAAVTVAGMQGAGLTIPTLPIGGSVTFSISADVGSSAPVGTLITNTASATVYGYSNSASDTNTVVLDPPPAITITDGASVIVPGGSSTYTVVIANDTGADFSIAAGNAALFRDPAAANLTVSGVTCSATGGASCPAATVAGMQGAGLTIPALPDGGSVTFSISATVNVAVPIGTVITNTATVTANGRTNSESDNTTVNYAVSASISVTPDCLYSGSTATFSMEVTNWTGVSITAVTPSALTRHVTGAAAIGAFTGPNPASIATLAHGASGTFSWTATVTGDVNDAYYVTGYASSGGPRTQTATSNTQEINGYTVSVDPASTYAGSTNQHLAWTITNYGCSTGTGNSTNIDQVAIAVPAGWTMSTDVYALAANTLFDLVETWTPSGTTFTSPNATERIHFTGSGIFDLVFATTPALPGITAFTITVTDDAGTPRTLLTTAGQGSVTVNPYDNSTPGQGNYTGNAVWQEQFR